LTLFGSEINFHNRKPGLINNACSLIPARRTFQVLSEHGNANYITQIEIVSAYDHSTENVPESAIPSCGTPNQGTSILKIRGLIVLSSRLSLSEGRKREEEPYGQAGKGCATDPPEIVPQQTEVM
jgi:hypothetical protein